MTMWLDIVINLVSDLLSWIIVGLALGLIALTTAARKRKRQRNFFGLNQDETVIRVYLSRLNVKPGGVSMIGGEDWPTFQGPVVSAREFIAASYISQLFQMPLLDKLPNTLRSLLSLDRVRQSKIEVSVDVCPTDIDQVRGCSVLYFGSDLGSIGARYYQEIGLAIIVFDNEYHELTVSRGEQSGLQIRSSGEEMEIAGGKRPANDLAVIQRLFDIQYQRTSFIVGGTGTNGTIAAARHLADNWEKLHSNFGDYSNANFAIVLECPNRRTSELGYLSTIHRGSFVA